MEVQGSTRALDVFNFLNGKFTFGGSAEHTRGFRMIFGIVIAIKATCVEFIPKMYTGVVDQFVMGCSPHSFFRKILGGLFLPFLLFMFLFHLHISKGVLPYLKSGKEIWTMLYFSFLVMAVINFAILMITRAHDLNNKEDRLQIEELVNNDPYLSKKTARCSKCDLPSILRSSHCATCDLHVAKYHEHSRILNKCIGAGNLLPYISFQFFLFVLFLFGIILLRLPKNEEFVLKKTKRLLFNCMYLTYLCLAFGRLVEFLKNLACVNILFYVQRITIPKVYYNITLHETLSWTQLGYLWKNPRKEFFNPFDKGLIKNIKEEIYTTINHEEQGHKNLNESHEEAQLRENVEDPEEKERRAILEEKSKIRNWRTEKITNLTSVYSSPMRKIFLEFINKKNQPKKGSDSDEDEDDE